MKAKRLLALTLALVLLISCMSITALADAPVRTDLATMEMTPNQGNYVLTEGNYYLSSDLTLNLNSSDNFLKLKAAESEASLVIDLSGHTLNLSNGYLLIDVDNFRYPVTIMDSVGGGKIILPANSKISRCAMGAALKLQSGTIEVNGNLSTDCKLIMTGGSIEMKNKGCLTADVEGVDFELTGGTITSPGADYGLIYKNTSSVLTIGGSFSVPEGICFCQGRVEFNNDLSNTIAFGGDNGVQISSSQSGLTDDILEKIVAKDPENQKVDYIHYVMEEWGMNEYYLKLVKNISVIYTKANPYPAVSSAESALDIGDISLKLFDDPVTYTCTVKDAADAEVDTITAEVDTEKQNRLKVTVDDATAGEYTITVTASNETDGTASCDIPFVVGTVLDREANTADIREEYTVPQNYDLTVIDCGFTDVTKVRLTWQTEEITASSSRGKVWDPDKLKWMDDTAHSVNSASAVSASFTLENLSSLKMRAEVSFARKASFTGDEPTVSFTENSETANDGKLLLGTVVALDAERTVTKSTPHSESVQVNLTPTAADFGTIAAGKGVYGYYTVKLVAPTSRTITAAETNFTADSKNAASMDEFTSTTLKYTAAEGYIFSTKYSFSGVNASDVTCNVTDNGKTAIVTVKNPTRDVVLKLNAVEAAKITFQNNTNGTLTTEDDYYVNVPKNSTVEFSEGGPTITATVYEGDNITYTTIIIDSDLDSMEWATATKAIETITADTVFTIVDGE